MKTIKDREQAEGAQGNFKAGQRVIMQSGGAVMTVIDVGLHTGLVWCRWLAEGKPQEGFFPQAAITADPLSAGL